MMTVSELQFWMRPQLYVFQALGLIQTKMQ